MISRQWEWETIPSDSDFLESKDLFCMNDMPY